MGFSASRGVRKGIAESLGGQSGDRQYQFNQLGCCDYLQQPGVTEPTPNICFPSNLGFLDFTPLTPIRVRCGQPPRPPVPQYRMNRGDAAAVVAYLKSLK